MPLAVRQGPVSPRKSPRGKPPPMKGPSADKGRLSVQSRAALARIFSDMPPDDRGFGIQLRADPDEEGLTSDIERTVAPRDILQRGEAMIDKARKDRTIRRAVQKSDRDALICLRGLLQNGYKHLDQLEYAAKGQSIFWGDCGENLKRMRSRGGSSGTGFSFVGESMASFRSSPRRRKNGGALGPIYESSDNDSSDGDSMSMAYRDSLSRRDSRRELLDELRQKDEIGDEDVNADADHGLAERLVELQEWEPPVTYGPEVKESEEDPSSIERSELCRELLAQGKGHSEFKQVELAQALELLKSVHFFKQMQMASDVLKQVASWFETQCFERHRTVCTEGTMCNSFFILVSGACDVHERGSGPPRRPLTPGSYWGDSALTSLLPYGCTVVAREPSVVLALRRHKLSFVLDKLPLVCDALPMADGRAPQIITQEKAKCEEKQFMVLQGEWSLAATAMRPAHAFQSVLWTLRTMQRVKLLRGLSLKQLVALHGMCEYRVCAKGATLQHEGRPWESLYIVLWGEVGLYESDAIPESMFRFQLASSSPCKSAHDDKGNNSPQRPQRPPPARRAAPAAMRPAEPQKLVELVSDRSELPIVNGSVLLSLEEESAPATRSVVVHSKAAQLLSLSLPKLRAQPALKQALIEQLSEEWGQLTGLLARLTTADAGRKSRSVGTPRRDRVVLADDTDSGLMFPRLISQAEPVSARRSMQTRESASSYDDSFLSPRGSAPKSFKWSPVVQAGTPVILEAKRIRFPGQEDGLRELPSVRFPG